MNCGDDLIDDNKLIILGKINKVHGVRGWVGLYSLCRPREFIFNYQNITLINAAGERQKCTLQNKRHDSKGLYAQFNEINNREQALALMGSSVAVYRYQLQKLEQNQYYWIDLIGLDVYNRQRQFLGKVVELIETGANDVLVISDNNDGDELLIPFVIDHYIDEINLAAKYINVDWCIDWN